ncbi:alpha/beta-hydrolase [Aspergillus minisclerotigenes]|uniref:Alpha/beta-hydrolase n=1 Tax=Aspergillus minisclerotigenes TaxID=656917 RepID=A0A5N6IYI5_9EURO|nr:alpha/beta-hydrolase [Aspergillus minisclerotigenes]
MATRIGDIDILFTDSHRDCENIWMPFRQETIVLPSGWQKDEGRKPMPVEVIWDRNVPIALRDNVTIYGDVFRPSRSEVEPVAAVLPWSPFGKTGTGKQSLDRLPWRIGVPRNATSGLEKWEGPDPAEWCGRGYAVVNVDPRGTFDSEGDSYVYGTQEGRDGYDTIEWIAEQSWCNGSVALVGNSWLGTTQWFIAAERPPHLKAIAPWEGLGDHYRESICRGGIPSPHFWNWLLATFGGKNKREDVTQMVQRYPLWNVYWEDKKPQLSKIEIPMYVLASYSTGLHTEGSLRGFLLSRSSEKWLRIHPTQEWYDQYQPENVNDLQRFLDRYLYGTLNGWEFMPRIRLSLLGYNRPNVVNRPVESYPPSNFEFIDLYLDASSGQLSTIPAGKQASAKYFAENKGDSGCGFIHHFDKYTELCGFSRVELFMSTPDHDDMDVYVVIRKLDKDGRPLQSFNIPFESLPPGTTANDIPHENIFRYVGPNGRLRASHRACGEEPGITQQEQRLLSEGYVWHPHDREERLVTDQIVKLNIGLWAGGMLFDAGEAMRLDILGSSPLVPEYEGLEDTVTNPNAGWHVIHTGGEYASKLRVALSGITEE